MLRTLILREYALYTPGKMVIKGEVAVRRAKHHVQECR